MTTAVTRSRLSTRATLATAAAVVLLAAGSTVAVAAGFGAFGSSGPSGSRVASCTAPTLPGASVSVQLVDMRSMMGGSGGLMHQGDWRRFHRGMMRVLASPTSASAGTVSLTVTNTGYMTHELVVLPLAAGEQPGTRSVRGDGTVDESGSLGEASASCAEGSGDGIAPGTTGWVTLHLPAGRYELVCNLPGHYAAGMYSELEVV
jgi:uncharacterized cupredoxin-like copper-binding protein